MGKDIIGNLSETFSDMGSFTIRWFRDGGNIDGKQSTQEQVFGILKVASVIASLACAYFFLLNPTALTFFKTGVAILALTEGYKVATNWSEIFERAWMKRLADSDNKYFINQLGQNTFVIGPLSKTIYSHIS